jgi:hypothetical protein
MIDNNALSSLAMLAVVGGGAVAMMSERLKQLIV